MTRPFKNPLTVGSLIGVLLSVTGWTVPRRRGQPSRTPRQHGSASSALPTAQNIFVHATRYDRATVLARDTILITTMGAVPVVLAIAALLG